MSEQDVIQSDACCVCGGLWGLTWDVTGYRDKWVHLNCAQPGGQDIQQPEVESPWQTGTPPEQGWYVVTCLDIGRRFTRSAWLFGPGLGWYASEDDLAPEIHSVIAWVPMPEPYRG